MFSSSLLFHKHSYTWHSAIKQMWQTQNSAHIPVPLTMNILLFGPICKLQHLQHNWWSKCIVLMDKSSGHGDEYWWVAPECMHETNRNLTKKVAPAACCPRRKPERKKERERKAGRQAKKRGWRQDLIRVNHWMSKSWDTGESDKQSVKDVER